MQTQNKLCTTSWEEQIQQRDTKGGLCTDEVEGQGRKDPEAVHLSRAYKQMVREKQEKDRIRHIPDRGKVPEQKPENHHASSGNMKNEYNKQMWEGRMY